MKVAVIGTGFVAQAYLRMLHYRGWHPLVLSRGWIDYYDYRELHYCLKNYQPDLVINCAGYTGDTVDDCEINRDECYEANVTLSDIISVCCAEINTKLIHISSGCIYHGGDDVQYKETDEPNIGEYRHGSFITSTAPFYQTCKLHGEAAILKHKQSWIFRIRMPFNQTRHPRNWLMKLCRYEKILDGINSVTFLDEFCSRSFDLIFKSAPGIYHAAYPTPVRTMEVAEMLSLYKLRTLYVKQYDPGEFMKTHVRRSEAVLDCSKFEKAYGTPFGDPMCALRWCMTELTRGNSSSCTQ